MLVSVEEEERAKRKYDSERGRAEKKELEFLAAIKI